MPKNLATTLTLLSLSTLCACTMSEPEMETPQVVSFSEEEGLEFLVITKNGKISAEALTPKTTHLTAK